MSVAAHLPVATVVLPLATAAILIPIDERRLALKASISLGSSLALLALATALLVGTLTRAMWVYALGNWPGPFGIVLVADRLSALMVLLVAVVGLAALTYSLSRWHGAGSHFHSIVHFLLAGLNGAFLTGDLFNLFVFFELLLAASYALALYGSGAQRVRASLHYIVVNLAASLLFLIGASLMYGVAGTLNIADLGVRLAHVPAQDRPLFEVGAVALMLVFLIKAAMWPLGFWLQPTYAAATPPSAALLAILSKLGVYAVMRIWFTVFGGSVGAGLLTFGGIATLLYGMAGVVSAQQLGRLSAASVVVSSGTLLAAIGLGGEAVAGPAIFYMVVSTLGLAALFLLGDLVQRARAPGAEIIAITEEAFLQSDDPEPNATVGVVIPAAFAVLGTCFIAVALVIAGLPPFAGFIAKFALLSRLLATDASKEAWVLIGLVLLSGLAAIIGFARAGVRSFWVGSTRSMPVLRVLEIAPPAALLVACLVLSAAAGPALRVAEEAARTLHSPKSNADQGPYRP